MSEIERADFRNFRTLSADRSWQQIIARASLPIVTRITAEARGLVTEIYETCRAFVTEPIATKASTLPPAFLSFEASMDSAVRDLGPESSIQTIEDIAFLVEIEVRQRSARLERLTDQSPSVVVIGECDGALRRVRKGCGAIDAAIANVEGSVPTIEFASELEDSLEVRRAYARFHSYVAGCEANLPSRLRGAIARIGLLAEGDVAPLLRVRDRLQILELQDRIGAWLHDAGLAVDGERLWGDIVGFAEMLTLVNRRQELVEHDRRVVMALLVAFETFSPERRVELVRSLSGIDPDVDRALASVDPNDRIAVAHALSPVTRRLGVDMEAVR